MKCLNHRGYLILPEKLERGQQNRKKRVSSDVINNISNVEINGSVKDFEPITLEIARPGVDLKRWRDYVDKYHMLGDKSVFGSRLQYFIKSGDTELGCMQFSASSWALEEREKWIGWTLKTERHV